MKKLTILICALMAFNMSIFAQTASVLWKKNFGGSDTDIYNSVTTVSDGTVAVGEIFEGSFETGDWTGVTGNGMNDAMIVKYNNSGNVIWKKNFGGSSGDGYNSVTAVSDGIVAVGYSGQSSFNNGDWADVTGKGDNDAIIVKYDNSGNVVWKKNFGGSGYDIFFSVITVSDGVVAAGYSNATSFDNGDWAGVTGKGGEDAIIVKYDNDGNVVWKKNFGGSYNDEYVCLTAVSDGIVVAGNSVANSFGTGDWTGVTGKGSTDAIIVKYDNDGDVVWKKNFGGSNTDTYVSVTAVSDGIVAAGSSIAASFGTGDWTGVTAKGLGDGIIVKYNNAGTVLWKKNFGGIGENVFFNVTALSDGVVAVGYSYGGFGTGDWTGVTAKGFLDAIIVKYNNSGNIVWKKNFGGMDIFVSVTEVSDGLVAAGVAYSFGSGDWAGVTGKGGENDATIVKWIEDDPACVSVTNINYTPGSATAGTGFTLGTGLTFTPASPTNTTIVWSVKTAGTTGASISGNTLNTTGAGTVVVTATISNGSCGSNYTQDFSITVSGGGEPPVSGDDCMEVKWAKNFGGSDLDNYNSVITVSDGTVAVGYSVATSFGNGDWTGVTGKGQTDAIIVKYDNDGNAVWKKNFGGSTGDGYNSVTAVSDGIVAVGYAASSSLGTGDWTGITGYGENDAIIVKYDNDGNIIWKKNFGGFGPDHYLSVTAVSDGIVAVGESYAGSFGNGDLADLTSKGDIDAIIVKYDNDGNVIWKKNFGGSSGNRYHSVIAVSDGIVAVGHSDPDSFGNGDWIGVTGRGGIDAIIVKYDNDGNVIWKKNFGGSEFDYYRDVVAVSDGIVAVGYSNDGSFGNGDWTGVTGKGNDDAIIVKYDSDGNVVWKKCIGGIALDSYEAVIAVSDGVVAVGTCFYTSLGTGDWEGIAGKGNGADAVIVKHDNSGNIVWIKSFGGYDNDFYHSVTAVSNGIVAVGHYTDLSPGTGDLEDIQGKGSWDAIIVKYSSCNSEPIEDCNPVSNIINLPTCTSIGNMALIGMITPTNATNQNIVWTVTGAGASISGTNNDILTTTSTGSVTVTATISDGLCGSDYTQDFNINVLEAVTDITYTPGVASTGSSFTLGVGLSVTPSTVTDYVVAWQVVNAGTTGAKIGGNILKATAGGTVTVRVYVIHNACGYVMFTKDISITVNDGCCN